MRDRTVPLGRRSKRPRGPVSCTREVGGGGPAASSVVSRALRGHEPTLVESATGDGRRHRVMFDHSLTAEPLDMCVRAPIATSIRSSAVVCAGPFLGGGLRRSVPRRWSAQAWSTIVPRVEVRSLTDAD